MDITGEGGVTVKESLVMDPVMGDTSVLAMVTTEGGEESKVVSAG